MKIILTHCIIVWRLFQRRVWSPFKAISPTHCLHQTSKGRWERKRQAANLAFLLSPGPESGAGLAQGCKPYTSGYMLGMKGSLLCSFADSFSWIIVLFSAFSSLLNCLVLWHFFHFFGMCLPLKQTQIWPEGVGKNYSVLCPAHCIQKSYDIFNSCVHILMYRREMSKGYMARRNMLSVEQAEGHSVTFISAFKRLFFCWDLLIVSVDFSSAWAGWWQKAQSNSVLQQADKRWLISVGLVDDPVCMCVGWLYWLWVRAEISFSCYPSGV